MTSDLFGKWLKDIDQKIGRQGHKILLLLGYSLSRTDITLNNVKLIFSTPNTTSRLQPMYQVIIQAVKLKYRKQQLRRILQEMEKDKMLTGTQADRVMTVLQDVQFVGAPCREISAQMILECFRKASFSETPGDFYTPSFYFLFYYQVRLLNDVQIVLCVCF